MHNHEVSADTYEAYPVARGVSAPTAQAKAEVMVEMGKKRSEIYDYLLSRDENVVKRDIDNMVRKFRKTVTNAEDDDLTAT